MNKKDIIRYCQANNLFTLGSKEQFEKVLDFAESCSDSYYEVAIMIWICSDTKKSWTDICEDLEKIRG